jgi:putative N6-adenine-specific DNA methylase
LNNKDEGELYVVTCQTGLEEILEKEIHDLGIERTTRGSSIVGFYGTAKDYYTVNMCVRTGLHVLKLLKSFRASDYDMLYYQARKINWHKLFDIGRSIRIDVKGKSRSLTNSQYVIHRIKDGIMDTFRKFFDSRRPDINKDDPDISIIAYLTDSEVKIYLDSSGQPLFKRGYRTEHGEAPIKEDLAAGIILLSGWDLKSDVLDPMCGAGTFLVEAYMIANNIPPNINRSFSFQNWFDYDENLFLATRESLKKRIVNSGVKFHGYEIDAKSFRISNEIMKKLKIEKSMDIKRGDFLKASGDFGGMFIVTNPPYDERLKMDDIKKLYKDLGDFLKQKCKNSNASVFTANLEAAKFVGLRTSAKIKLYNGPLEARLLKFEIY